MLGFDVPRHAFVATSTAIGLVVDAARVPIYLAAQGAAIANLWPPLAVATLGGILGTLGGERILRRVPERIYRKLVSALLIALGAFVALRIR